MERIIAVMITGILFLAGVCAAEQLYISDRPDMIVFNEQQWGELGLGTCAYATGTAKAPMQIGDRVYEKGLGCHASGRIAIDLGRRFLSFEAEVGVQRQPFPEGSVVFEVYVDDRKVFDSGVMRQSDAPKPVKVSVQNADELILVVTDAGDGIICDCANWADARLIPDPGAKQLDYADGLDVGQFAQVCSWNPGQAEGTRAGRVEEFPAEDLFPEIETVPEPDGSYRVPDNGCIGLQWLEPRQVRALVLRFADSNAVPPPGQVQAQYWAPNLERGGSSTSRWQGRWNRLGGEIVRDGNALRLDADWTENPDKRHGTIKVRWLLPPECAGAAVERPCAYTNSRWATAHVVLQADNPAPGSRARIEPYNAEIVTESAAAAAGIEWDMSKPLRLAVRHGVPKRWMFDRGSLRIKFNTANSPNGILRQAQDAGFGIAIDDLLKNGCIWAEDFGVFAAVEPVKQTLEQYKERTAGEKTILERVREMPDQTFEQAMEHAHRAEGDLGPTLLSLACENHKYIHHRDGTVNFDTPDKPWTVPGGPRPWNLTRSFGTGAGQKITRKPEDGWLPIAVTDVEETGAAYRQRTYVAPFGSGPDGAGKLAWLNGKPLCVCEYTVENPTAKPAAVSMRFAVSPSDAKTAKPAVVMNAGVASYSVDGKPIAWISTAGASPLEVKAADGAVVASGTLPAKSSARCVAFIPGWYASDEEIKGIADTEPLHERTVEYWQDIMSGATRFDVPHEMLSNIIKASQVHCLMAARSEDDERVAAWIGAVNYGPLESEAHAVIRGMLFTGNTEYARRSLDFFIRRYNPRGFLTTGYTVMGTGWHLWTLGEYYALTRDREWLERNAAEIARVCRWVMAQREKTKRLDARGEKVPEWGLMPPGVCADWSVYAYYHYINGNFYAGLKSAGEALADIGHPDAEAVLASARELKECILRAYHWTQSQGPVFPLKDGTWVPMYPTQVFSIWPTNQMYPSADSGRSWCYDVEIGAHHLVPTGVMDPDSREARWMMDHMEDVQFLADGWFYYPASDNEKDWFNLGGFAKVQPYYARTVEVHGLRDDVKPFIRSYFNSLISLLNREDLSLWEHFINGAYNKTHETGYFLYQTRMMFAHERGDELWVAPFVTSNWLRDGMSFGAKEALTAFGKLSYRVTSHVKQGYIDAEIAVPARRVPSAVVVRLRHPDGKKIKAVTVNGRPHSDFDPAREIVRINPEGSRISVRAEY